MALNKGYLPTFVSESQKKYKKSAHHRRCCDIQISIFKEQMQN